MQILYVYIGKNCLLRLGKEWEMCVTQRVMVHM